MACTWVVAVLLVGASAKDLVRNVGWGLGLLGNEAYIVKHYEQHRMQMYIWVSFARHEFLYRGYQHRILSLCDIAGTCCVLCLYPGGFCPQSRVRDSSLDLLGHPDVVDYISPGLF